MPSLYTDGEAWKTLYGFGEMIKHMIAAREPLIREHPDLREKLLSWRWASSPERRPSLLSL